MIVTIIIIIVLSLAILGLVYYTYSQGMFGSSSTSSSTKINGSNSYGSATQEGFECPKCPECPRCPECPKQLDPNESLQKQNEMMKSMIKYLTLIIRKNDAEKELFRLEHGHHRVFHSPRIDTINNQIALFKTQIKKNPDKLQFFEENLDLLI